MKIGLSKIVSGLATAFLIAVSISLHGQTIMYSTGFESTGALAENAAGTPNQAPLNGPLPTILQGPLGTTTINTSNPFVGSYCLNPVAEKSGGKYQLNYCAYTPPITLTAGKFYLIEVYASDNSAAADFYCSSVPDGTTMTWDVFQTDANRIKHMGTNNIEPDNYASWTAVYKPSANETRIFGLHCTNGEVASGTSTGINWLDNWSIKEYDCAPPVTGAKPLSTVHTEGGEGCPDVYKTPLLVYDNCIYQDMEHYPLIISSAGPGNNMFFNPGCWSASRYPTMYQLSETPSGDLHLTIEFDADLTGFPQIAIGPMNCVEGAKPYCAVGTSNPFTFVIPQASVNAGDILYIASTTTDFYDPGLDAGKYTLCANVGADCDMTLPFTGCIGPGDAYAVYAPDNGGGNVDCNELAAAGGAASGVGRMFTQDGGVTESGTSFGISGYDIINADNFSCTTTDITLTDVGNNSDWTNGGADPFNLVSGPLSNAAIEVDYSTGDLGWKDLTTAANTYCDFLYMQVDAASPSPILGSSDICPGSYNFTSGDAGTPGYSYQWVVKDPVGGVSTIADDTLASTAISFTNTTTNTIRYVVKLVVTSECCGPLDTVYYNTDIFPLPDAPTTISPDTNCVGGDDTLFVTPSLAGYSYSWYDAASAGNLLSSGDSSHVVDSTFFGDTWYYVEAVDNNGCISADRDSVLLVGVYYTPDVPVIDTCITGYVPVCVQDPVLGATYNWYTDASADPDSLVQTGVSICYDVFVDSAGASSNIYVTITDGTCDESAVATGVVNVTAPYTTLYFKDLVGDQDWFNGNNWVAAPTDGVGVGCIPSCQTNATILAGTRCEILFSSANVVASCKNLTIAGGATPATLKFMESKSQLDVCGNWTNRGILEMFDDGGTDMGRVNFVGTDGSQRLRQLAASTGDFYKLGINNTSLTPIVYVAGGTADRDVIIKDGGELWLDNGLLDMDFGTSNKITCDVRNSDPNAIRSYSSTSYVVGNLKREVADGAAEYVFPVGNMPEGGTYYESLQLLQYQSPTGMAGAGMTELTVRFDTANANDTFGLAPMGVGLENVLDNGSSSGSGGYNTSSQDGIWTMEPDVNSESVRYNLTLQGTYYLEADTPWVTVVKREPGLGIIGNATNPAFTSPNVTNPWSFDGSVDAPTGLGIQGALAVASRTGFTGFSQVAIAVATTVPLAVDFLEFEANVRKDVVYLDWSTSTEKENDHFIVQRSRDDKNWEDIGRVEGNGTTKDMNDYDFVDSDPYGGVSYYRLMVVNKDGGMYPSPVRSVKINKQFDVNLYPNPAKEYIDVNIESRSTNNLKINVYNSLGKLVYTDVIMMNEGATNYGINLSSFAVGVYHLQLKNDNITHNVSFIKE